MYVDYKREFPNSTFKDDSLKDHLRDSLKDMKSRVSNPETGDVATVQDEDLMCQLMHMEPWKAKIVLKLREDAMQGVIRKLSLDVEPPLMTNVNPSPSPKDS